MTTSKNTILVKIGGSLIADSPKLKLLMRDLSIAVKQGYKFIIVHGGGIQADELSIKLGIQPKKIEGRRITSHQEIDILKMLYGGSLNLDIIQALKALGLKAIRLSGVDGDWLEVTKRKSTELDYGLVADFKSLKPDIFTELLKLELIPVVAPLSYDQGEILNINADTLSLKIAQELKLERMILISDIPGVLDENNQLITRLNSAEANRLIKSNIINGGMHVKVNACLEGLNSGIKQITIINGFSATSQLLDTINGAIIGTNFEL